ncbi:MAG: hypothetical protein H7Z37_10285, partial [Pyrinomonadaceae bacterium]|nr:hypothetical protein [Pyrinomonadaceae bacterium]
ANAQNAPEITVSLNEQFLNSFLDSVFNNLDTPKFQLSKKSPKSKVQSPKSQARTVKVSDEIRNPKSKIQNGKCDESITLLRENGGVKTSVRFADGKIIAPLAFAGKYDFPFIGCTDFTGWAETKLDLGYDAGKQALIGRARVQSLKLNGVPNLAGGVLARIVQGTIDRRINPVNILKAEQVSPLVPVQYANGTIKLRAVNMSPEITNGALNVKITYEFSKAN